MTFFFLYALMLLLASLVSTPATARPPAPTVLTLPSGRQIPAHLVRQRVPSALAMDDLTAHVYEVSTTLLLTGNDRAIDLRQLTVASRNVSAHSPHLTLNGVDHVIRDEGVVRRGGGYTVAHTDDGAVVGVWGNRLVLQPLDHLGHPGVLVNVPQATSDGGHFSGDMRFLPEASVQAGSRRFGIQRREVAHRMMTSATTVRQKGRRYRRRGSCRSRTVIKEVKVAIAFDNSLCELYGNSPKAAFLAVRAAVEEAGVPFRKKTCLRLKVVDVDGACEDPKDLFKGYKRKTVLKILDHFSRDWSKKRKHIARDVALYLPGAAPKGNVVGVAWQDGVCSNEKGYCWAANQHPFVIAHELGHILGATHTSKGLMQDKWTGDERLKFGEESVEQIAQFVDTDSRSTCLTTASTDNNDNE